MDLGCSCLYVEGWLGIVGITGKQSMDLSVPDQDWVVYLGRYLGRDCALPDG